MTDEYGGDVSVPQIQVRSVTLFNMLLKYPSTSIKKSRSQVLVLLVPLSFLVDEYETILGPSLCYEFLYFIKYCNLF